MRSLVIVTPVYEDLEAAEKLFSELHKAFPKDLVIVAVDDGSIDSPLDPNIFSRLGIRGELIRLKRNLGHQRAIAVGLNYVAQHYPESIVVVMDSDGEDSPQSIDSLLARLAENIDIVVAERRSRVESMRFQVFYALYKRFFALFTGKIINFGNFMAISPSALQRLAVMPELWLHLAGCVLISKLRIVRCPIDRASRYAGKSKMNFVGLVLHGVKGLMVFAEEVFVRVGIFCAAVAFLSILLMPIPLALKFAGLASPGWASILIGVFLLIFIQTGTLTLLTLLLTGLAKGRGISSFDYKECILEAKKSF
jgi:hypothetical protein